MAARPRRALRALGRRTGDRLRRIYYARAAHRSFPGKAWAERAVAAWETRLPTGDVPLDRGTWEEQYASGHWDFLDGVRELAHYAVVVGYGQYFAPGGSVLDVGCGTGVLFDRWRAQGYSRYVGVDISDAAVAHLRERALPDTEFVAADAEAYEPTGAFDVVVFNESITYLTDPVGSFERYARSLAPEGVVVVSCHEQSDRAQAILRDLMSRFVVLDDTLVRQHGVGWRVAVLRPDPAPAR